VKPITPSQQAKKAGLKSLSQVSKMQGVKPDGNPVVSLQTLDGWAKNKPLLFENLLLGCKTKLFHMKREEENEKIHSGRA